MQQYLSPSCCKPALNFLSFDLADYTALTGDTNFESGTVPGPLVGGMIADLLRTKLPGRGTNWLKQRYSFQPRRAWASK